MIFRDLLLKPGKVPCKTKTADTSGMYGCSLVLTSQDTPMESLNLPGRLFRGPQAGLNGYYRVLFESQVVGNVGISCPIVLPNFAINEVTELVIFT